MLAGPYIVVVLLLAAGAALEFHGPAPTVRALKAMGLPASAGAVRVAAAAGIVVCVGALAVGGAVFAGLVAVSYLLFTGFVLAALLRRVPLSSCGCFGADDTPPTATHLVVNLAAAAVAVAVASTGRPRGLSLPDESIALQGAFVLLVMIATWFAYTALTLLPRVLSAAQRSSRA